MLETLSGPAPAGCPVNSYNEWDPLEEVIVGTVKGAMVPAWHTIYRAAAPESNPDDSYDQVEGLQRRQKRLPYPKRLIREAAADLDNFIGILEREGVTVRRPDDVEHLRPYASPTWEVANGFSAANPRDVMLVVGSEIIEAPMADRGRYFETFAYRSLLKEYFRRGARWTAAPKPELADAQYVADFQPPRTPGDPRFVTTEFEPTFDAADFVRCGRDIFGQRSHVTNMLGIEWLRRHLAPEYRVHVIESRCPHAMHIDTTIMPLAPGRMLVNPEFVDIEHLPAVLKSWELLVAPRPTVRPTSLYGAAVISYWVNVNVLSLDENRIIVERSQQDTIDALKRWGFTPIPCAFENYYPFMGSFHCATLDVRRRGTLQSYF